MAPRKKKSTKRSKARRAPAKKAKGRAPSCCECPSAAARKRFKAAKTCSSKMRALDEIKKLASEDATQLKPGARQLAFRDLLRKQQQANDLCAREEASDSSRFNGLRRVRRVRRRRARR